jgi:hypothetical protein
VLQVTVTKDDTIILDGSGDKSSIQERCDQIREAANTTTSDYDRDKLQERLAKLSGGVAVLKIGGASEVRLLNVCSRLRVPESPLSCREKLRTRACTADQPGTYPQCTGRFSD